MVCRYTQRKGSSFDSCSQGENGEGEELSGRPGGQIVIMAALRSSRVSMGFGYMRRRCTSKAKHSSATSLGRDRDRPVRFSIRCNRWRTVFGWRVSTSAAPCTDASVEFIGAALNDRRGRQVVNDVVRRHGREQLTIRETGCGTP